MNGFLVDKRVMPLWLVQHKRNRSSFGLYVGDPDSGTFIPATEQLIRIIPEDCWDFGNNRVYVNPIAVSRAADGQLSFDAELEGSPTLPHALALLQLGLPDCVLTRFELPDERILARATSVGDCSATEQMLVVMLPGESVKAVGYRAGKPIKTCRITFDGKEVRLGPIEGC